MSRIRKAWRVSAKDYDGSSLIYAATAGKARMEIWRSADCGLRVVDIIVRRAPESDVQLPDLDPIYETLTEEEIQCLMHAYGADNGDPTKAGYRDYFYTRRDDPPLVMLAEKGLMSPMKEDLFGKNMTYFVLTDVGKRVALSMTPEYSR